MAAQLDQVLKLGDKLAGRQLKKTITATVDETFDLSLLFTRQPQDTFDELERKLTTKFPQFLDNPRWTKTERRRKMDAVYHYARAHFSFHRCLTKPLREDGSMPRGTVNEYREKKRLAIRDLRKKYQNSSSSRRGTPALSRATPAPEQAILTKPSGSKTMPNISRSTRPGLRSSTASQITLVDRSSPAPANFQLSPLPASLQTHVEEVADFLRTCNPDMTYFLPAFIDFGCRSRSYLEALASYSDEHMDDIFMKMASKALPEVVLTEMDIWVLKQGLKEFVDTTKSGAKKKRKSC